MKILVVAQYYRPDITAAAFRIAETVDLLSEAGHAVTVITSEPHRAQARDAAAQSRGGAGADAGTTGEASAAVPGGTPGAGPADTPGDTPGVGEPSDASPDTAASSAPAVHRVPIDPLSGSGMRPYLRHFFSFVIRARRAARRLIRTGYRPDVIWVSSPPLFVGLVGTAAKRWSRAPLVLDIRDVWPDTAVAAGQLSQDGRAYRIGRRLEHFLYRRADAFSCVAAPMAEYLRREVAAARGTEPVAPGAAAAPGHAAEQGEAAPEAAVAPAAGAAPAAGGADPLIEVVYNGAGFAIPPALPANEISRGVLYAGNLGRLQGVDALIDAWATLDPAVRAGWRLELIGTGVMEEELRRQVAALGIGEIVQFRGVLPKEETVKEIARAGVLFLNLLARPVFDLTIPSKLFDYLAVGRPIIGGITGEGRDILAAVPANRTVAPNDSAAIARALESILSAPEWNRPVPENQRIVEERYSRRVNTEKLSALFARLKD